MAQSLNKGVGGSITTAQAKKWIQNYKDKNPGDIECYFYGSDIINEILNQNGCVGLRILFALDDAGTKQMILVGGKENGNNIWPSSSKDSTPDGIVGDNGWPCPPGCYDNPLE
jgi:hypothetical protein